jgi:uncharacterized membrane protein
MAYSLDSNVADSDMQARFFVILSFILFVLAVISPVTAFGSRGEAIAYVAFGWMGIFMSSFGWFANVAAVLSAWWLTLGEHKASRISAVIALIFLIDAFFLTYDYRQINYASPLPLIKFGDWGFGFYLWAASIVVLAVGSVIATQPSKISSATASEQSPR